MSKSIDSKTEQVLDKRALELLGSELQALEVPPARISNLRKKIMRRIDTEKLPDLSDYVTIRANEGEWEEIAPKLHKKLLHLDPKTGVESYLLRAEPGAETPPHVHDHDEVCLVLEGEVEYDEFKLTRGDYHYASKGSQHSMARTQNGALLFLQTALAA